MKYEINTLYEAVLKNTKTEGPMSSVGRMGVDFYNKLGYVPYDVKINEFTCIIMPDSPGKPRNGYER